MNTNGVPPIHSYINSKTGCPKCAGQIKWTYDEFVRLGTTIHEGKYSYHLIHVNNVTDKNCKLLIHCNKCGKAFSQSLASHIRLKTGCPRCRKSKGETVCEKVLGMINIEYVSQASFESHKRLKYDFAFVYKNIYYIIFLNMMVCNISNE